MHRFVKIISNKNNFVWPFFSYRATLEEMRRQAAAPTSSDNKNGTTRTTTNTLVKNAQPLSFTNPPPYDSNVQPKTDDTPDEEAEWTKIKKKQIIMLLVRIPFEPYWHNKKKGK